MVVNTLKSKKKISSIFEKGSVKRRFPLSVFYIKNCNEKGFNIAFSVGKKNIPLAVNRNKIKRFLRELCRKEGFLVDRFEGFSCVLVYCSKEMPTYESLKKDLVSLFNKF